jgi:integrase
VQQIREEAFPAEHSAEGPSATIRLEQDLMAGHIRKRQNGAYQARWLDPEGREKSKTFHKKSEAEKHLVFVQNAILTGAYVDANAGKITVGQMAEEWLRAKVNLKESTLTVYRHALDGHVRPRWGDVPLSRVAHSAVQAWVASLSASGLAGATVRKIHLVLSGVLDLAVRDRRINANPAAKVHLPRSHSKERHYLTAAQVELLAFKASALPSSRPRRATDAAFGQYRLVILLLAYSGLRWSEAAALKVRNVDIIGRRVHVVEGVTEVDGSRLVWGTPKSHERRAVPLAPFLADMLAVHLQGKRPDELVFTSPEGGVMRNRNARRAWFDRAAKAIDVPGLTPHDLRHTAASLAVSTRTNVLTIQRMLGHASAAMTLDIYADLFDSDLDELGAGLDALRGTAASQSPRTSDGHQGEELILISSSND